jgi:hypothetical protein
MLVLKSAPPLGDGRGTNLRDRPPLITTAKVNNDLAVLGVDFGLLPGIPFL